MNLAVDIYSGQQKRGMRRFSCGSSRGSRTPDRYHYPCVGADADCPNQEMRCLCNGTGLERRIGGIFALFPCFLLFVFMGCY